jgi:hypothetical protein
MSAFTTSFTGVRVVSKTTVAKKTVQTKAVASFDNVKKVRDDDDDDNVRARVENGMIDWSDART